MKKTNIRIIAALLACALTALSCGMAFAVNTDYSGEIDPVTSEPLGGQVGSQSTRAVINSTMYYDWNSHCFVFPIQGTSNELQCTAADGMVLSETASVINGGNSSLVVYCNGEEVEDQYHLSKAGDYVVSMLGGGTSTRIMSFTIVGPVTNALHRFSAPDGFFVLEATLDGEDILADNYTVDMEKEGLYSIRYLCSATDVEYELETVIDRTPPELSFSGNIDKQQRVHSALTFTGYEDDGTIVLLQDGTQVSPTYKADGTAQILNPGNYIMRAYDAAGNMREYTFQIMMYVNASGWFFFLLVAGVIAGVFFYIRYKRKHLKIG